MAWTAPRTWVATNVLTAAQLNTDVRDNTLWLGTRKGFKIRRVAAQSIASGAGGAAISFDTEDSDTDGFGTVTSTAYTIPSGLDGVYGITLTVVFAASPGTAGLVRINAGGLSFDAATNTTSFAASVSAIVPLTATQTIGGAAFQTSGGAVNATATLWATWLFR